MVYFRKVRGYGPYAYLSIRKGRSVRSVYAGAVSAELANWPKESERHRKGEYVIRSRNELGAKVSALTLQARQISLDELIADPEARKSLAAALQEFEEKGVTYMIGGINAVNCLVGRVVRYSEDVDLRVDIKPHKGGTCLPLEILAKHGFKGEHGTSPYFARAAYGKLPVDIMHTENFPITGLVKEKQKRSGITVTLQNRSFPALPVEDVLLAKAWRLGLPQDREDIRLIGRLWRPDWRYIDARAKELGEPMLAEQLRRLLTAERQR